MVLCIFNHSNKNTQLDATINRKIYCFVVQTLLNMFRALLCPSSGARHTAIATSGFRMNVEVEVFSAVVGLLVSFSFIIQRNVLYKKKYIYMCIYIYIYIYIYI